MKKVLALALAVVLAFGMSTVAFAANAKVNGMGSLAIGSSTNIFKGEGPRGGSLSDSVDFGSVNAQGDTQIYIYLENDNFSWDKTTDMPTKLTSGTLSNISVKKSVSKGSDLIRDIDLKYDTKGAYVRVRFIEYYVSTSDKDFDFKIYLTYKSSRGDADPLQITGTIENTREYIYEDDDYCFLGERNTYAEADDYIKGIEFDLGNGVSITTNAFDGKKYYGVAIIDITSADEAVVNKYPEIDCVYTLKTVNLKGAGNIVTFDIDDTYYVYGSDGTYLGLSSEKLPFSDKYYMATARIDMNSSSDVSEEPSETSSTGSNGDTDPANPPMGGDDGVVNENDNPGTGANGFVNVAVVAGVVALAAAGAVSLKK